VPQNTVVDGPGERPADKAAGYTYEVRFSGFAVV